MTDESQEYERLVAGTGYAILPDWTCVRVAGRDRAAFLNNLCTNRIEGVPEGEGGETFFTDVKGHTLAHTLVLNGRGNDEIRLWGVPGQSEALVAHLDKYLIREDVQLEDLSPGTCGLLLSERTATAVLGDDWQVPLARPSSSMPFKMQGVRGVVFRCDWFGAAAVVLQVEQEKLDPMEAELQARGAAACGPQAVEVLRLEHGTPYFGTDFDNKNLPQEVNRDEKAVSFTKGCYLGQETVARIDALGHVNRLLVGLRFSGPSVPERGTPLLDNGREVGQLSSSGWSYSMKVPIGLAMIRRGSNDVGTRLESAGGPAEVVRLPR